MKMVFPEYEESPRRPDYHAVVSIELGELIEGKWVDWTDESWHWDSFDDDQYKRVCEKFDNRYYHREIGVLPPGAWKMELLRKFNEIMPKYKPVYQALKDGQDILSIGGEYGKDRVVYSDFPATQLKTERQDYASNATDKEYEHVGTADWIEKMAQMKSYNDVDVMILDEMDSMFSSLLSVSFSTR